MAAPSASGLAITKAPTFTTQAGINRDRAVRQFEGDEGFILTFLGQFATEVAKQMDAIEASLDAGDFATGAAGLHKLRGSAGTLCAMDLVGAAQRLEDAIRAGEGGIALLRSQLRGSFRDLQEAMVPWLGAETLPMPNPSPREGLDTLHFDRLLAELEDLLTRNRFNAKRTCEALEALLTDTAFAGPYESVAQAVKVLYFQEALTELRAFRTLLSGTALAPDRPLEP